MFLIKPYSCFFVISIILIKLNLPLTYIPLMFLPISNQLHKYNREPSSAEARPAEAAITIYQAILATKLKFFSIPDNVQCAQLYYYQARGWGRQGLPFRHLPNIILLSGEKILNKICPSVRLWLYLCQSNNYFYIYPAKVKENSYILLTLSCSQMNVLK